VDTEIQQAFINAFNSIVGRKEFIIDDTTQVMELLTD